MPELFDMLLFTWMIPHTDDFGRLAGSPAKIKGLVVPMMDKTKSDIEESLGRLHDAELINWVEANQIMVAYDIKPTPVWVAVCTVVPLWKGLAFGATWRAAVEEAMRKEARLQQ